MALWQFIRRIVVVGEVAETPGAAEPLALAKHVYVTPLVFLGNAICWVRSSVSVNLMTSYKRFRRAQHGNPHCCTERAQFSSHARLRSVLIRTTTPF